MLFNFQGSKRTPERGKEEARGGVAQLGEHLPCKQGVMGSIPIISTNFRTKPLRGLVRKFAKTHGRE